MCGEVEINFKRKKCMKTKDIKKRKKGDIVIHNRYGKSTIKDILWSNGDIFGVAIKPLNSRGKLLLETDSASSVSIFMEDNIRRIKLFEEG